MHAHYAPRSIDASVLIVTSAISTMNGKPLGTLIFTMAFERGNSHAKQETFKSYVSEADEMFSIKVS